MTHHCKIEEAHSENKTVAFQMFYQFSKRLTIHKDGIDKSGGKTAYAWFVWDKQYAGEPVIRWIK